MGDGYCMHCNYDDSLKIGQDFLANMFSCMKRRDLLRFEEMIGEEIDGNCDTCGAETSRALLDMVHIEHSKRRRN